MKISTFILTALIACQSNAQFYPGRADGADAQAAWDHHRDMLQSASKAKAIAESKGWGGESISSNLYKWSDTPNFSAWIYATEITYTGSVGRNKPMYFIIYTVFENKDDSFEYSSERIAYEKLNEFHNRLLKKIHESWDIYANEGSSILRFSQDEWTKHLNICLRNENLSNLRSHLPANLASKEKITPADFSTNLPVKVSVKLQQQSNSSNAVVGLFGCFGCFIVLIAFFAILCAAGNNEQSESTESQKDSWFFFVWWS